MDISNLINAFSYLQADINNQINSLKSSFNNESELWEKLEAADPTLILDDRIINIIADAMQMVNDKERLKSCNLNEIKTLYQLLVKYSPDNLQYQIDLIDFTDNVLNNEDEAQRLAKATVKLMMKRELT